MKIHPKAAACANRQAASDSALAGRRKHSTRRAVPSFVLPIDDRYRLTADELAWRVERRKGKPWRAIEWHGSIEGAVNSLGRRLLRTSEVGTVADALAAVDRIACTLRDALEPAYKVEVRS